MKISEMIEKLQAILDEHGDMEVAYIDNGDFAENGGWTEPQVEVAEIRGRTGIGAKAVIL